MANNNYFNARKWETLWKDEHELLWLYLDSNNCNLCMNTSKLRFKVVSMEYLDMNNLDLS